MSGSPNAIGAMTKLVRVSPGAWVKPDDVVQIGVLPARPMLDEDGQPAGFQVSMFVRGGQLGLVWEFADSTEANRFADRIAQMLNGDDQAEPTEPGAVP